ncbi:hypothetical protein F4809DRAFT_147122 [Biscogniauxia mediterranea]|nr:hypothetical protein F4809DRAFT_147122 [Biscogniauxia mediterranea]
MGLFFVSFFWFLFSCPPFFPPRPLFFKWTRCTHNNRSSLRITPVHARTYTMYTDTGTNTDTYSFDHLVPFPILQIGNASPVPRSTIHRQSLSAIEKGAANPNTAIFFRLPPTTPNRSYLLKVSHI